MYDAIIIGARAAGSPTAMLLARKGYRVLLLDRATFPSDTLSTHQIQIPGSLALKRWGLFDKVLATGLQPAHRVHFDMGEIVLEGEFPSVDGVDAVYSPRRYLLDKILVDAAVDAEAELRQDFIVEEVVQENGRVVGIRGRSKNGSSATERARMVIGADGKHSLVAKTVDASKYDEVPALICAYYSYWEGVPLNGGEIYGRVRRYIGIWPTNDQMTIVFICWPAAEFDAFRADVEGGFMATLDRVPALAERLRGGRRAERFAGTADMPNFFRKPFGPGWALVGDAGHTKDPISGMGISDAFQDAELLVEALDSGFAGRQPFEAALAEYEQKRNTASKPFYDLTIDVARMNPSPVEHTQLYKALQHNPVATSQFFGVLTGVVQPTDFFNPQNLFKIIGMGGMAKIMLNKIFQTPGQRAS